jgi:hypothetical protein
MKYFIDTEFLEGTQDKRFCGFKYGTTKPTIDLISIGIVSEDAREYYAISKDFNLEEAWSRYDIAETTNNDGTKNYPRKVYWIRENVLRSIFEELAYKEYMSLENPEAKEFTNIIKSTNNPFEFFKIEFLYKMPVSNWEFNYKNLKRLINKYNKSNKQIAKEVKSFCYKGCDWNYPNKENEIQFYGYYSNYDWVVFCWLFGKMKDLPNGFLMYCIDLRQMLDEKDKYLKYYGHTKESKLIGTSLNIKEHPNYPKQTNEHNALADARWNFELYKFLQNI